MFFIFRMIFWMIVVMLVLPTPRTTPDQREDLSIHGLAARAASAATSYCMDNAEDCVAGLATARALAAPFESAAPREAKASDAMPERTIALPPPRPAIP